MTARTIFFFERSSMMEKWMRPISPKTQPDRAPLTDYRSANPRIDP